MYAGPHLAVGSGRWIGDICRCSTALRDANCVAFRGRSHAQPAACGAGARSAPQANRHQSAGV